MNLKALLGDVALVGRLGYEEEKIEWLGEGKENILTADYADIRR